jgi:hypothetical protein
MKAFGYALGKKEMLGQGVSGLMQIIPEEGWTCSVVMGVDQHNRLHRAVVISGERDVRILCMNESTADMMSEWIQNMLILVEPDAFICTLVAWVIKENKTMVSRDAVQRDLDKTFFVRRFDEADKAKALQAEQAKR